MEEMTIVEFVEKVWECKLSDVQKDLLTATYEFYKANPDCVCATLAIVFDEYKSGKLGQEEKK